MIDILPGYQLRNNLYTYTSKTMVRKISLQQVTDAVYNAYEEVKFVSKGEVNPAVTSADANQFGIAVVLTDGTTIIKGDVDVKTPVGAIAKLPVAVTLLSQNTPDELVKKAGIGCHCDQKDAPKPEKPHLGFSARGVRAVSAVEPQNDPDGKYDIIINNFINLMNDAPELDDKLYESLVAEKADAVNKLAEAGFYLYDNAETSVDIYLKLMSLKASARQLATLGATIAADGVNPLNNQVVFDGKISQNLVAMLAMKSPKIFGKAWLMKVGVPAKSGFGGAIVAVLPGFGAIAAYSPAVNERKVSVKAAKAIASITNALDLSVFASARVEVEK